MTMGYRHGFQKHRGRFGTMNQSPRFARGGYGRGYQKHGNRGGFGQQTRKPSHTQSGVLIRPDKSDTGNEAYTGMLGKRGPNSSKMTPKYSALPPPGHNQWDRIEVDTSIAHIQGVGANFRADKRGVKVCINWKRGSCKFGDRCIYNHGEPGPRSLLQAAVDSNISPLEKDLVGYRIASNQNIVGGGLIAEVDGKMVWTDGDPPPPPEHDKPPEKSRKLGKSGFIYYQVQSYPFCLRLLHCRLVQLWVS